MRGFISSKQAFMLGRQNANWMELFQIGGRAAEIFSSLLCFALIIADQTLMFKLHSLITMEEIRVNLIDFSGWCLMRMLLWCFRRGKKLL